MQDSANANLLVVDDEPRSLAALGQLLSAPDRSVVTAQSGKDALRQVLKTDFALILLDVRMPGMDGFETAALIRQLRRSRHTPIIFLTAAVEDTHSMSRGYEIGGVDYILKPVDPAVLLSKVAVFVDLYGKNAELTTQIHRRREAERELFKANEDLEARIRERTANLSATNDMLQNEVARRMQVEADLRKAKQAAEAANLAKSQFLANMSHEIRTPMNAVIGMTELALQTQLDDQQREYLQLVRASGEALLKVINEILDFSKIEAGRLEVESIAFPLRQGIGEVVKTFSVQALKKGLELTCEIDPEVPEFARGDPIRLRQILSNLVDNAIKFTERGGVALEVRRAADSGCAAANGVACEFTVRDTGIGIAKEKQETIFAPFLQADASTTRIFGGTGLGLTICARLVEMMQGRIWVESEPGQGSAFHFTVRFGALQAPANDVLARAADECPDRGPGGALRVLLVEDNPVNRKLAEHVLAKEGHSVCVAENGEVALELFRPGRFDAILMDVQMPKMDGIQATIAIREAEKSADRRVPIIALTAHAMAGDRERCLGAGMDEYLVKPIRPATLAEALRRLQASAAATAEPERKVVIDRATLLERVNGDMELLGEITSLFIGEHGKLLAAARDAAWRRDAGGFQYAVHTLRGMLRNLSAPAAEETASILHAMDPSADSARVEAACAKLEGELSALREALVRMTGEAVT
jgi:signal transduction histidine kinase